MGDRVDVTTYGDLGKVYLDLDSGRHEIGLLSLDEAILGRAFADAAGDLEEAGKEDIDWGCCDEPRPRILEANGRLFCASCRLYLDRREEGGAEDEPGV